MTILSFDYTNCDKFVGDIGDFLIGDIWRQMCWRYLATNSLVILATSVLAIFGDKFIG